MISTADVLGCFTCRLTQLTLGIQLQFFFFCRFMLLQMLVSIFLLSNALTYSCHPSIFLLCLHIPLTSLSSPYLSVSHIPHTHTHTHTHTYTYTHTHTKRSPPVIHTPSAHTHTHTYIHTHTHTHTSLNGFLRRGAVQSINISQL